MLPRLWQLLNSRQKRLELLPKMTKGAPLHVLRSRLLKPKTSLLLKPRLKRKDSVLSWLKNELLC